MPVLVVDDYSTMVRIIRNLLRQLGFEDIDDAADGSAALEKMTAGVRPRHLGLEHGADDRFDCYAASAPIRRSRPPVHHGDGGIQDRERHRAKKAGVNNYIVKPFNAQTLKAKIEAVFAEKPEFTPPLSKRTPPPSSACGHSAARVTRQPPASNLTRPTPASPPSARLRRFEYCVERGEIGRVARAVFLGMDARGHENIIEPESRCAFEIGAYRIADASTRRRDGTASRATSPP